MLRALALAGPLALVLAACGDNATVGADAGSPADAAPAHPVAPEVVSIGGAVLATPAVVPIFFTGDDAMQAQIEQFLVALKPSAYWTATTSEYGVGPLTIGASIVTTDAPPTTDDAAQAYLAAHLDGAHSGWPASDPNTIYAMFLPAGAALTLGGDQSCVDFAAYHAEVAGPGGKIVYAMMPRCTGNGSDLDDLTESASHEFVEAATDPHPYTDPAYADLDVAHYAFGEIGGAEVGDMCEFVRAAPQRIVGNYVVQRSWSNASARAGHDPCVPVLAQPYIVAVPTLADPVPLDYGGGDRYTSRGAAIPVNATGTIDVQFYSDADAPAWSVKAYDAAALFSNKPAQLELTWDQDTGKNGDVRRLTIHHLAAGDYGASTFVISARTPDTTIGLWWGYVAN
jgi:hypothetical protein